MKKTANFAVLAASAAIVLNLASAQMTYAQAGTEGGGGVPGTLEAVTESYRNRILKLHDFPVGYNNPVEDISTWCERVASVLEDALVDAQNSDADGDMVTAEGILEHVLQIVQLSLSTTPNYDGPIARRLVDRALEIQAALKVQVNGQVEDIPLEARYQFLRSYVRFAVEQIENFDRSQFVPYQFFYLPCNGGVPYARCPIVAAPVVVAKVPVQPKGAHGGSATAPSAGPVAAAAAPKLPGFDLGVFQKGFKVFAVGELQFALGPSVLDLTQQYGNFSYVPVGDERASLRIAEHVARHVAEDLSGVLDHVAYACVIQRLKKLATDLQGFNQNTGFTSIRSGKRALNHLRAVFTEAKGSIDSITCGSAPAAR